MAKKVQQRVVIFTGGRLRPGSFVNEALAAADTVIAADSGALKALEFKQLPSVVIGDLDSLDAATQKRLTAKGTRFIIHERDKDQTDTELAVAYAIDNGATEITVLGGIEGDRLDHILANVFLMTGYKVPVRFVNGPVMAWAVKGPGATAITGRSGDTLSLLPLTPRAGGIKTTGLKYPLRDESLRASRGRGVSNLMTRKRAAVSLSRGTLLIVQNASREL